MGAESAQMYAVLYRLLGCFQSWAESHSVTSKWNAVLPPPTMRKQETQIPQKKVNHVTLTTPLLGVVCHRRLGFDIVYLHAKFDDSSFSRSTDITGAPKFKVSRDVTLLARRAVLPWSYN